MAKVSEGVGSVGCRLAGEKSVMLGRAADRLRARDLRVESAEQYAVSMRIVKA